MNTPDTPLGDELPARLSTASASARAAQQARRAKQFIKGPIPMAWLETAAALPGKALAVALLLWFRRGFDPDGTDPIHVTPTLLARFGVGSKAGKAAVLGLRDAGLVTAEFARGRCPRVFLQVTPTAHKPVELGKPHMTRK